MLIDSRRRVRELPDKRIIALAADIEKGVRILRTRWNFSACWNAMHFARPINLSKLTVSDRNGLLCTIKSGQYMPSYEDVERYIMKLRAEGERRGLFTKEDFPE